MYVYVHTHTMSTMHDNGCQLVRVPDVTTLSKPLRNQHCYISQNKQDRTEQYHGHYRNTAQFQDTIQSSTFSPDLNIVAFKKCF